MWSRDVVMPLVVKTVAVVVIAEELITKGIVKVLPLFQKYFCLSQLWWCVSDHRGTLGVLYR